MKNEATISYVRMHRKEDVRALALKARRDDDIDLTWALDQIQGWQTATHKLPSWAAIDGIIYPPHLSMEQCSSEQTALYKCAVVNSLPQGTHDTLIDLTGGFGVDFGFMARCCKQAIYVERQEHLCETAKHNFSLMCLDHATVIHGDAEDVLSDISTNSASTLLYLDPARRDSNSSRTYAISDCTPDVLELRDRLFEKADHVMLKLSPMLDWHKAVSDLGERVVEVHIVSVANECKELLILMKADHQGEPAIHCVNDEQQLCFKPSEGEMPTAIGRSEKSGFIYEPNASIMKAGCFGLLTERYPVKALATDSHLFVSSEKIEDFPGRRFAITAVTTMNKKELGQAMKCINRANVATRNFPMSAQQLRQRLRLQDGGDLFIFGTTDSDGHRLLFLCHKV